MAYVGQTSIRSVEHMEAAIAYVANPEKALNLATQKDLLQQAMRTISEISIEHGENATYLNCTADNTYRQFEWVRQTHNQDKGVIAHHYYQSFSPDDHITPELAHKIGVELASKMFQGFQVVVTTHIDKNHLHNHILVNSCHMETGLKWLSNKKSLQAIRHESDRLCKRYGMSVIEENPDSRSIDKTTYQLGMQGKSWKIALVNDLDAAVQCCRSKTDFEAFFRERGYEIRYTAHHITFKKEGEKKGIRADTLAKQFGEQYTKVRLEQAMGYTYNEVELTDLKPRQRQKGTEGKSHWERLTERTFAERNPETFCTKHPKGWYQTYDPPVQKQLYRRFPARRLQLRSHRSLLLNIIEILFFFDEMHKRKTPAVRKPYQFRIQSPKPPTPFLTYGTIPYSKLVGMTGENYSVTVNAAHLLKLANHPLLYAARIDRKRESATITVKACDKDYLAKLLGMEEIKERLEAQSKRNTNRAAYAALKRKAAESGQELQFIKVTEAQLTALQEQCQEISFIEREGGITVTYLSSDEDLIRSIIAPKKDKKPESEQQKNNRIYAALKKAAALENTKLCYKANVSMAQIRALEAMGVQLAYFAISQTAGLYKIALAAANAKIVNDLLRNDRDRDGIPDHLDSSPDINYAEEAVKKKK